MDHRSYQPVTPCSNKLLQKRWDQKYYDEHRRKVMTAKPMVDVALPKSRSHLDTKFKKLQIEKERRETAQRDNANLLHKMQHIMVTHGYVDQHHTYQHHSLNASKRQREHQQVTQENMAMLKRLQEVRPMYRVSDWAADWARKEQLVESITAYPTASRVSSAKRTHTKAATSSNKGGVTSLSSTASRRSTPSPSVAFQKGRLIRVLPVDEDQPPLLDQPPPLVRVSSPSELPEKVEQVAKALENLAAAVMENQGNHHNQGDPNEAQGGHNEEQGDPDEEQYADDYNDPNDLSDEESPNDQSDQGDLSSSHNDPASDHGDPDDPSVQALTSKHGATM